MMPDSVRWTASDYTIMAASNRLPEIAEWIATRVFRTTLDQPGFCVVTFDAPIDSSALRRFMCDLLPPLAEMYQRVSGRSLVACSAMRFDQQVTTKPHLDGGPEQSALLLGYEPTAVNSQIEIFDYLACSLRMGLTPQEFLAQHNPMFRAGYELLRPYRTRLESFDPDRFQLVVVNNSHATHDGQNWLGTLHTATILNPNRDRRRVINSMMVASMSSGATGLIGATDLEQFVATPDVARRGYDSL